MDRNNYTLLTDFYEFTMSNGLFNQGYGDKTAYFDMFFRQVPDDGGFAIMAGVEQLIDYLKNLSFSVSRIRARRIPQGKKRTMPSSASRL